MTKLLWNKYHNIGLEQMSSNESKSLNKLDNSFFWILILTVFVGARDRWQ